MSNTTFWTIELLLYLSVQGRETELLLINLNQEDHKIKTSIVISLDVLDLEENNMAELPTVFSAERLPISESNIPSQKKIDKWSHLGDVKLQSINAQVGRLIGNDAPRALAVKAILG